MHCFGGEQAGDYAGGGGGGGGAGGKCESAGGGVGAVSGAHPVPASIPRPKGHPPPPSPPRLGGEARSSAGTTRRPCRRRLLWPCGYRTFGRVPGRPMAAYGRFGFAAGARPSALPRLRRAQQRPARLVVMATYRRAGPGKPCAVGSGPRYQILSHVFARCATEKTYGHARIARDSRMAVGSLTRSTCKNV